VKVQGGADHTLLYSFPSQEYVHPVHFNMDAYAFLAFSPDDQFVATGTRAQADVRIWDLKTGKLVKDLNTSVAVNNQDPVSGKTFTDHDVPDVACVAFTQDSKVIILAGDHIIIFKTFPAGEFINEINIDPYTPSSIYITACATSEDGRLLAIGDSNGNVGSWNAPSNVT
jgi:WD40 repeat protein